jgi:hypothetical protein
MDLSGAVAVEWCGVCNAEPAIGYLEFEHDDNDLPKTAVGEKCMREIAEAQRVPGWTDEWDTFDTSTIVW